MAERHDTDSFGFLVTDVARLFRAEIDRRTSETGFGLTTGEGRLLTHAARAGEVRQSVLAERMGIEAMTLSGYLDRLEARGLVERIVDPTDRRAKCVRLTPEAGEMLKRIHHVGAELRNEIASAMTAAQWKTLNITLRNVRDTLSAMRSERGSCDT